MKPLSRSSRVVFVLLVGILVLSACRAPVQSASKAAVPLAETGTDVPAAASTPSGPVAAAASPTGEGMHPGTALTASPKATGTDPAAASASPTTDLRPSPADWKIWPVLPERISPRAVEIYQHGLALGNDPHAYSITGDCQAIRDVMLGEFDDARKYRLKPEDAFLEETIAWFQGSFNRDGAAVRGGFNAASVLSPIHADPQLCAPGETPLGCEFRIHNPSILLISLEVWNDRAHLDRYEMYLRQIIEYSIEEGVLPVLMTKADMAEALKHVINPLLVQLAYEYDLPLINFWLAVQPLPDHGIDPDRDGFHISKEAWWVKSLTALKALDVVRRSVSQASVTPPPSPTPVPTLTPAAALTPTPQPTREPPVICNPPGNCLLFDLARVEAGQARSDGVYLLDLDTGEAARLAEASYRLQALSPDGSQVLLSGAGTLVKMSIDGAGWTVLSEDFLDTGGLGATWLNDHTVAMLAVAADGPQIVLLDLETSERIPLTAPGDAPIWLYPAPFSDRVFWEAGVCVRPGECQAAGVQVTGREGGSAAVAGVLQPEFSPDAVHFAFMDPEYTFEDQFGANFRLVVEELAARLPSRRLIAFPPANGFKVRNRLESYAWSPDGARLMVLLDERSYYYGRSAGYHTFLFTMQGGMLLEYERLIGEEPRLAWASDGEQVLFSVTTSTPDGGFAPQVSILTPAMRTVRVVPLPPELAGADYRYIDRLFWLPAR